MTNQRRCAVSLLMKIERDAAYSNLVLSNYFSGKSISPEGKAFVTALVYGVLDRKISLDYVLGNFMKTSIKKLAPFTLNCLRVALYQIMFMDKIPQSAAVNEAVKLIKASKENRNAGFVNAVLRSILRAGEKLRNRSQDGVLCWDELLPKGCSNQDLSIRYSCPLWITQGFINDYGTEYAEKILAESLKTPTLSIRVNTLKVTCEDLMQRLEAENIECLQGGCENSLLLPNGIDVTTCKAFSQGLFHIQGIASQKAVEELSPKPYERVLDLCAAPGGKSFTMAQYMQNKGEIVACDIYEHRTSLIKSGAQRLGITIINTVTNDAVLYNEDLGKFDCILCDVPCSGLGVIGRKPDIKYKAQTDFTQLCETQYKIISTAQKYLKSGGRLLYSTCTLRREENQGVVIRFEKEYNDFCKLSEQTLFPHINATDGFYFSLLKKE